MLVVATPNDLLRAALTNDSARPFLTFYDDATNERVELSVRTFENWVAKTANLLQDELSASVGSTLALALPVHWQAAVWLQAGWALGMEVLPVAADGDLPLTDVTVTTPDRLEDATGDVVSLSLRPALLAATTPAGPLPGGVLDGDSEVLAHGDRFLAYSPPAQDAGALTIASRTWTLAELVDAAAAAATDSGAERGTRSMSTAALDSWAGIAAGLLVPLSVDGSVVLVRNAEPARLEARRAGERVDLG